MPKGYKHAQAKSQKAQKMKYSNSLPMEGPAMSIATPGILVQEDTEEGGVPMLCNFTLLDYNAGHNTTRVLSLSLSVYV